MVPRRQSRHALPFAAAEVLEVRALLSGAAGLVHHAQHAAALHAVPDTTQHPAVTVQISTTVLPTFTSTGSPSFSISTVNLNPGSSVHAKTKFSALVLGTIPTTFSGPISGKVLSSSPVGVLTEVKLAPVGGSITVKNIVGGKHHSEVLVPEGTVLTLDLDDQGRFVSLEGTYVEKNGTPGEVTFLFFTP